jgi:hypothetical protein
MRASCIKSVFLVISLGVVAACGGGGGGSNGAPAAYSGVTTQAAVTTSNAKALSADAYENGGMGTTASLTGVEVQASSQPSPHQSSLPEIGTALKSSITRAVAQHTSTSSAAAGAVVSETIPGGYSGSATISINVNDASGAFTGTITYNNLKETTDGPALSGAVTFSGVYNNSSQSITSMTLTFSPLTVTAPNGSFSVNGTMSFSISGTSETLTVSCTVQGASQTFWVKDWTYTFTAPNTLTISGRYYHPTYGYVDVTTLTPLTVSSVYGDPTAGVLLFTGANGTKAKLTFTSTGYTVDVDTTGNGQYVTVQ